MIFTKAVKSPAARLFRFGIVGVAASGVHWVTVVAVVSSSGMPPLAANVAGFLVAFAVSFAGHKNWTFADRGSQGTAALPRFLAVALCGFAINEGAYYVLLKAAHIEYRTGLVFAIALAAASTYVLSHFWAFRQGANA